MKRVLFLGLCLQVMAPSPLQGDDMFSFLKGVRAEYYLSTTFWWFNDTDNPTILKVKVDRSVDFFQNFKLDLPIADWLSTYLHFSFADFSTLGPLLGKIFGASEAVKTRGSLETGLNIPFLKTLGMFNRQLVSGFSDEEKNYIYLGYRLKRKVFTWSGELQDVWLYSSTGYLPYQGSPSRIAEGQSYSASNDYTSHSIRLGLTGFWGMDLYAGLLLKFYRTAQPMMFSFEDQIAEVEHRITALEVGFTGPLVMFGGSYDEIGEESTLYLGADFTGYLGGYNPVIQDSSLGGGFGVGTKLGLFLVLDMPNDPKVYFRAGGAMDWSMFGTFGSSDPSTPLTKDLTYQSASSGGPVTLTKGTLVGLSTFRNEALFELIVSASIKF